MGKFFEVLCKVIAVIFLVLIIGAFVWFLGYSLVGNYREHGIVPILIGVGGLILCVITNIGVDLLREEWGLRKYEKERNQSRANKDL